MNDDMNKDLNDEPGEALGEERPREDKTSGPAKADVREARLEQALRANLLKRKKKARAGAAISRAAQEGGTGPKGKG